MQFLTYFVIFFRSIGSQKTKPGPDGNGRVPVWSTVPTQAYPITHTTSQLQRGSNSSRSSSSSSSSSSRILHPWIMCSNGRVSFILWILFPLHAALQSYSLYTVLTEKPLTPDITFAALSVFNQLSLPLFLLPMIFTFHVNAVVSTRRLTAFFTAPEVEEKDDGRKKETGDSFQANGTSSFDASSSEVKMHVPGPY